MDSSAISGPEKRLDLVWLRSRDAVYTWERGAREGGFLAWFEGQGESEVVGVFFFPSSSEDLG